MSNFKEKINKLSSITGHSSNINERFLLSSLESSQSDMLAEIEAKKELLQSLTEQEEACAAELETLEELDGAYLEGLKAEVEGIQQKYKILDAYIIGLNSEDFVINKMNSEAKSHINDYWLKIKPLVDKTRSMQTDFNEVKELHKKCLELLQKTETHIAPPH